MKCFGCRNWPGHASLTRAHVTQEEAVPRIVPRVVVELERPQEYLDMLTGLKADVIKVLAKECKRSRLDGLVRLPHASPGDAWNVYPRGNAAECWSRTAGPAGITAGYRPLLIPRKNIGMRASCLTSADLVQQTLHAASARTVSKIGSSGPRLWCLGLSYSPDY